MSSQPPPPPSGPPVPQSPGPLPDAPDDGHVPDPAARRWGLGDAWIGILASQLAAAFIGSIILIVGGYDSIDEVPMTVFAMMNLPLHFTLAGVAIAVSRSKGEGAVRDFRISSRWRDVPSGLFIGVAMQFLLVPAVTLPFIWLFGLDLDDVGESARELADRADDTAGVIALIFVVGVVAPLVEELFFRGLLFESYRKRRNMRWLELLLPEGRRPDTTSPRWNLWVGIIFSSAIFSVVHFQLILIPALFAVGVVLAVMTHRTGRLGPAIWAHAAFNATTLVTLLA
ncbi:MAG: lysostaphin resistance A-like protein [Acidimicrobiales bacterium]